MEKTRFSKTVPVVILSLLIVCLAFSLGALAVASDGIVESARISSVNVSHGDAMRLAFKVEETGSHEGTVGIMIWEAGVTDFTAENSVYSNYTTSEDPNGTVYYAGNRVSAYNIATEYQVAVVEKDSSGNVTLISKPVSHSIQGWAQTKLAGNPDADRANLYNKVIDFGKAASMN